METVLFINGCIRTQSRTMRLAKRLMQHIGGEVQEVDLEKLGLKTMDSEMLRRREELLEKNELDAPDFCYAAQLAAADVIVVAAPYWDLSFPAAVKAYFERVLISGITFAYSDEGIPVSLCKAKKLYYVTTSGGYINYNLGFDYVKALAELFFSIPYIRCFTAEGLDIIGADTEAILSKSEKQIDECMENA